MASSDLPAAGPSSAATPHPTWCGAVELGTGRPPSGPFALDDGRPCRAARLLVRLHGEPLGSITLDLPDGELEPARYHRAVFEAFTDPITAHLRHDGLAGLTAPDDLAAGAVPPRDQVASCSQAVVDPTPVTVVVCTRNRADQMRSCLAGLLAISHPNLEVLIVDNAPTDDSTEHVFGDVVGGMPGFRYVRENRPGLSRARNKGLAEATNDIVAFTDDDVTVDQDWVTGLLRGFRAADNVACVTGLVATAALETVAEYYFDARVDWGVSCTPRLYDMGDNRPAEPLFPYSAGRFGTGANFAVHAGVLRALGGFDEALGAGTPTEGGEDLDAFVRVLLSGHALAYEPSALVWHRHRSDIDGLRRQMWGYGTGLTAYLAKHLRDRRSRADILRAAPRGLWRIMKIGSSTRESYGTAYELPRGLLAREYAGMVVGPLRYAQALRQAHDLDRSDV